MWCALITIFEDNNQIKREKKDFRLESRNEQEQSLALMVNVKKGFYPKNIDDIITRKSITDMSTIEFL
jgi:hypothetical protein